MTNASLDPIQPRVRSLFQWGVVFAASSIAAVFVAGLICKIVTSAKLRALLFAHFPATIGLPAALLVSVCIVIILDSRSREPIELAGFGMSFKGASGQIVLCTFLFLAITIAIRMLW